MNFLLPPFKLLFSFEMFSHFLSTNLTMLKFFLSDLFIEHTLALTFFMLKHWNVESEITDKYSS